MIGHKLADDSPASPEYRFPAGAQPARGRSRPQGAIFLQAAGKTDEIPKDHSTRKTAFWINFSCGLATLLRVLVVALALLAAVPAAAHPVPFSYLDLEVHDTAVDGRIRVHLVDIAPVLGLADPQALLDPAVRSAHRAAIERYLASRIAFERGGFQRARWGAMAVVDENEALELTFTIPGRPEGALALDTNLFPADPNHQTFVNVYEDGDLRQQFILVGHERPGDLLPRHHRRRASR